MNRGDRVSLAWFRRNKFRLHPSHDFVAGPSRSRGHGRPRHPNLPYCLRCTRTIALQYHFSDIMSHSYCSKVSFHKLIATISEPFEVVVILYLPKDRLWFNRPLTSVLQPILTRQQFSGHRSQFIVPVIHPVQCKTKEGDET